MGVTVKELADLVGTPIEKLLEQFKEAGLSITDPDQAVSDEDKESLLNYLRRPHNRMGVNQAPDSKLTLRKKTLSQLKVASKHSKGNVVEVEVRKKRTFLKSQADSEVEKSESLTEELPVKSTVVSPTGVGIFDKSKLSSIEEELRHKEAPAIKTEGAAEEAVPVTGMTAETEGLSSEEATSEEKNQEQEKSASKKHKKKTKARVERVDVLEEAPPLEELSLPGIDEEPEEERFYPKHAGRKELRIEVEKAPKKAKHQAADMSALTKHKFARPTAKVIREVTISETITAGELAQKMSLKSSEVIRALMKAGVMATINQPIDQDTASIIVEELGHTPILVRGTLAEELLATLQAKPEGEPESRPPVVTVMGHVDHGKTSLLDAIRRTQVAAGEAGGITQHIGAYQVHTSKGHITFLDTPGHAAFTAMRARGSQCTDIVVLVVAADDGVMPQTEEAIAHAKAAGVPIIVAINKIDKPGIDLEKLKTQLGTKEVVPEEWGGDSQFIKVSAKTGQGIDDLLNAISLQAELADLKAIKEGAAQGLVVESRLDKGRGPVATVLVQQGTLKQGDVLLAGGEYGRVRNLLDENGKQLTEALPSTPVQVVGLSGVPRAGDQVLTVDNERKAKEIAEYRQRKLRESLQVARPTEQAGAFAQLEQSGLKKLAILLKADVHGSVEALSDALEKLSNNEVKVSVVYKGVGGITESDIHLAKASQAIVIGFNVRAEQTAKRLAEEDAVSIYYYSIIYEALEQIKKSVDNLVAPVVKEVILGTAEVKDLFKSSKMVIAGCLVIDGVIRSAKPVRVLRNQVVIYDGVLSSLRRFKDDVSEVRMGTECGIGVKDYTDLKAGDKLEVYEKFEL